MRCIDYWPEAAVALDMAMAVFERDNLSSMDGWNKIAGTILVEYYIEHDGFTFVSFKSYTSEEYCYGIIYANVVIWSDGSYQSVKECYGVDRFADLMED